MNPSPGLRPRLIVRESRLYQVVFLLVLLAFGAAMLYFAGHEKVPPVATVLLGGVLLLFVLIQVRLLGRALSAENWLLKFYADGIALQPGGYLAGAQDKTVFIPAEALRGARILRQPHVVTVRRGSRSQQKHRLFIYLEIDVDKSRVRQAPSEPAQPDKTRGVRASFIHVPITETAEGYRIQLRSEQSRVSPSVRRIAGEFRQFGIQVRESRVAMKLSSLNDADFEAEVLRMQGEGREQDAIGALRQRHRLSGAEARERLEALAGKAASRDGAND
ncbi:MAG: hypothetical protein ABR558_06180 [Thioalkalivibrio sp.]